MTASTDIVSGEARARSLGKSPLPTDRGKVLLNNPRVRMLIRLLIEGDDIKAASRAARLTVSRARIILHEPTVRRAYFRGMEVLRESERPRNILLAVKLRDDGFTAADAASRKVAIEAARYLDGDDGKGPGSSVNVTVNNVVGYVMDLREDGDAIGNRSADAAKPLIEHASVRRDRE